MLMLRFPLVLLLAVFTLLTIVGCATVEVDGRQVNPTQWQQESKRVKDQAAFLFKCPSDDLELKILDAYEDPAFGDYATVIGVSGCGDTAIYKRIEGHWVLDGARTGGPA